MGRWMGLVGMGLALVVGGCGTKQPGERVSYVAEDDPRMNAAMAKARGSVGAFIAAVKAPRAGQSRFSVKVPIREGENVEHVWVTPVAYDGSSFQGAIDNVPEKVKSVRRGQKVTIKPTEISDWMYIDNGKLVGGETLRVLREAMSESERMIFDKSLPFVIE